MIEYFLKADSHLPIKNLKIIDGYYKDQKLVNLQININSTQPLTTERIKELLTIDTEEFDKDIEKFINDISTNYTIVK